MRRWLAEWPAPILVIVIGCAWLLWLANQPVSAPVAKVRTDKTHQVVIPTDRLLEYPVLLTVELRMDPADIPGLPLPLPLIAFRGCARSVSDIQRIQTRALEWLGQPHGTVNQLRWAPISLDDCLKMVP